MRSRMPEPTPAPRMLLRAAERGPAHVSGHPYEPRSEQHGWLLSRPAGLARLAVNLIQVPPGKVGSPFHAHHREEEWAYVLEGQAVAEVDQGEHAVGPGDFLAFPPGVAHALRNESDRPFLFLVGGEVIPDVEVADFPRLRRRMVRIGGRMAVYPFEAEVPFLPPGVELPPELFGAAPRPAAKVLVRAAERPAPRLYRHPENPRSEVELTHLSRAAGGLARVAAGVTRVPAGRESYVKHAHLHDEEWMYVLSGRGTAELGEREEAIGPGDFLGFPAGGPPHHVRCGRGEDLVYVHGGDAWSRTTIEIVDFPTLGLRKNLIGTREATTFPLGAALEARKK